MNRFVLGAITVGLLGSAALWSPGQAGASCASFSGVSVGQGCQTTARGDVAIGIGRGTEVRASGGFNTAIAIGPKASATADGQRNRSVSAGDGALAETDGIRNRATAIGNRGFNVVYGPDDYTYARGAGSHNRALAIGTTANTAVAEGGDGTTAGRNTAAAVGQGNWATAGVNGGSNKVGLAIGRRQHATDGINNK